MREEQLANFTHSRFSATSVKITTEIARDFTDSTTGQQVSTGSAEPSKNTRVSAASLDSFDRDRLPYEKPAPTRHAAPLIQIVMRFTKLRSSQKLAKRPRTSYIRKSTKRAFFARFSRSKSGNFSAGTNFLYQLIMQFRMHIAKNVPFLKTQK